MLIVIDGTNIARRAYHAGGGDYLPSLAARLRESHPGARVVIAWDSAHPYWRHELWADYKAHRRDDPQAQAFVRQAARQSRHAGLEGLYAERMEADDVAATLVASTDDESIVVTTDKDWCQLIADGARWLSPNRGSLEERDEPWVWANYRVGPGAWPDYVALAGDPSDGIPGVRGIGPKRAADLLREHGTAEEYARSIGVWGYNATLEQVMLWKRIATLRTDAELREV